MNFIATYWYVWLLVMVFVPATCIVLSAWLTLDSPTSKKDDIVLLNVIVFYVCLFFFGLLTSLSLILNVIRWAKNV